MTNLTKKSVVMVTAASIATIALEVYTRDKAMTDWIKSSIEIGAWAVFPYVILFLLLLISDKNRTQSVVAFVGSLLLVLLGVGALYDGFFIHLDAQNGLLFLFIPLWQLVGSLILGIIIFAVHAIWGQG
jgi:hypothetical protein